MLEPSGSSGLSNEMMDKIKDMAEDMVEQEMKKMKGELFLGTDEGRT